jgi:hypothetical protein
MGQEDQDGSRVFVRNSCKKIRTVAGSAFASKRLDQTDWIKTWKQGAAEKITMEITISLRDIAQ